MSKRAPAATALAHHCTSSQPGTHRQKGPRAGSRLGMLLPPCRASPAPELPQRLRAPLQVALHLPHVGCERPRKFSSNALQRAPQRSAGLGQCAGRCCSLQVCEAASWPGACEPRVLPPFCMERRAGAVRTCMPPVAGHQPLQTQDCMLVALPGAGVQYFSQCWTPGSGP